MSKFQQDWKNVYTYVDYDFENEKWMTPLIPESFGSSHAKQHCVNVMKHAADALKVLLKKTGVDVESDFPQKLR